jgi:hypothetical protein
MLFLNIIFAVVYWQWSKEAFDEGRNVIGYMNLFISAMNGAAVAANIF